MDKPQTYRILCHVPVVQIRNHDVHDVSGGGIFRPRLVDVKNKLECSASCELGQTSTEAAETRQEIGWKRARQIGVSICS